MYIEDNYSKHLMQINALYKDKENVDKKIVLLKAVYGKLKEFVELWKNILQIHKVGVKKVGIMIKAFFFPNTVKDFDLPYSFDHTYELDYKGTGKVISGRIAVYTSIFGGYDTVLEPYYISDKCDYYIVTDQEVLESSVWKKVSLEHIPEFEGMDNYHKSKYCKMMPHILFPEYEYSIWVDGNVQIVADLVPLVDRLDEGHVMGTFKNPLHDCVYTERNFLICKNAANYEMLNEQISSYAKEGLPKHFGMREFTIIVRKHTDELCQYLMQQWWEQVNTYTMRDQISFPYLLWKNKLGIDYIQLLGENWRDNPRFISLKHQWRHTFVK